VTHENGYTDHRFSLDGNRNMVVRVSRRGFALPEDQLEALAR